MVSRRRFLRRMPAAAMLAVQARMPVAASPAGREVPAPIAALPDLRGQARPFTREERLGRIERARARMEERRLDAILLANHSTSARYFADLRLGSSERLSALVLPARGRSFLVCPAFEAEDAEQRLAAGPLRGQADVLGWHDDEDPFLLTAKALRDRTGLRHGACGLDEEMKWIFAEGLARAAPHLRLESAVPVTAGCRMIKSDHEMETMALACRATLLVYRAVYQSLAEGMTTDDVSNLVDQGYRRVGFPGEASLNIGEFTALPHGSDQVQRIREGTILMLDDGCEVEGYWSDITRTFVLGRATDTMRRVFDIVRRAQSAALAAARPGAHPGDVDRAARKLISDAGYGPGFRYFSHRVGHGIGMDMHEWPYLVDNNMFGWDRSPALESGMVFSNEPGIYIPGQFGIRLEDDMHITADGARLFTPASPSLEAPFANVV